MLTTNANQVVDVTDNAKLEFYKLIGEGFQAIQEGRTCTLEEVREAIETRRKKFG